MSGRFDYFTNTLEKIRDDETGELPYLNSYEMVANNQPCLHDQCPECHGTGRKADGSTCIHMISCPCPKCSPHC